MLQSITAIRDADGVHVRDGQRRTRAALPLIPIYVLDGTDTDTASPARPSPTTNGPP